MLKNLKIRSRFHIKLKNSKKKNHNNPTSPFHSSKHRIIIFFNVDTKKEFIHIFKNPTLQI